MYNGKEENIQKMLDKLCEAIQETGVGGGNHYLERIELIYKDKDEDTGVRFFPKGYYVKPIWHNLDPIYYDDYEIIDVHWLSGIGTLFEVIKYFETIW